MPGEPELQTEPLVLKDFSRGQKIKEATRCFLHGVASHPDSYYGPRVPFLHAKAVVEAIDEFMA